MNGQTILLVDDDADLLDALSRRCSQMGLEVEHARNLLTATRTIARRRPDVVCVDVNMPTGSGLQFCAALTSDPQTAELPIVVLSGQQTPETLATCQRLGIPFVAKGNDAWEKLEPLLHQVLTLGRPAPAAPREVLRTAPLAASQNPSAPADEQRPAPRQHAKQVVVADDDHDLVHLLAQRFATLGCSVIGVSDVVEAINVIHRITPDLVVLDVKMPGGNGLSVCEMMASDERLRATPVIILTGCSDESTIRRCHDLLVFYVQKGGQIWDRVEPLARELLRIPEKQSAWREPPTAEQLASPPTKPTAEGERDDLLDAVFRMLGTDGKSRSSLDNKSRLGTSHLADEHPPWVLCIDDDADFSDALRVRFEQHGVAVVRAQSGMEGFRLAFTTPASAIVLDYSMPDGRGDYVLDRLKTNPVTRDIPVFVVTGTTDKMVERRMEAMGAASFFRKPVDFDALLAQLASHLDVLAAPAPALTGGRTR